MASYISFDRQSNQNDENADCGPSSTDGINHRQELVSKRAYGKGSQTDSIKDEKELPIVEQEVRMAVVCVSENSFR